MPDGSTPGSNGALTDEAQLRVLVQPRRLPVYYCKKTDISRCPFPLRQGAHFINDGRKAGLIGSKLPA